MDFDQPSSFYFVALLWAQSHSFGVKTRPYSTSLSLLIKSSILTKTLHVRASCYFITNSWPIIKVMLSNQLEVYTIMTANLSQSFDNNKKTKKTPLNSTSLWMNHSLHSYFPWNKQCQWKRYVTQVQWKKWTRSHFHYGTMSRAQVRITETNEPLTDL